MLYVHHKWHTDTVCETDLVRAEDMGQKFYQPFSYVVVQFGDVPAVCIARIVGHDQAILHERPSEVAPHAPAMQADFRVSSILQVSHTDELETELLQYQIQATKKGKHTAELYCKQGSTDITELVGINETT